MPELYRSEVERPANGSNSKKGLNNSTEAQSSFAGFPPAVFLLETLGSITKSPV